MSKTQSSFTIFASEMTLKDLNIGSSAVIKAVGGTGTMRQHLLDMGMIPGAGLTLVKRAPMGDPIEVHVHGYSLTLRLSEAAMIEVSQSIEEEHAEPAPVAELSGYNSFLHEHNSHPGLGEAGKYHSKDHEHRLEKGTVITMALAGQQNCGKTTLFNQLTGSNQHVGNFPGVTVDRKDGSIKGHPETCVTDLPGIYSLSTYTEEEIVAREFIFNEKPKAIINVVDATNIERNLYLTIQLMEMEIPMVLALNIMDELRSNGGAVRINEMEKLLGIPVVPIAAGKGEGINELVEHAMHIATFQEKPARQDFCDKDDFGGAVHRCLHSIMHLVEDHAERAGLPKRFVASRLVEGDKEIMERLDLSENEKAMLEEIICEMEEHRGMDRHAAMADMRFSFISRLCSQTVVKPRESKERRRSNRIDKILTGRWTAIPAFIAIMALVFWMTFDVIGLWLQDILDAGITAIGGSVDAALERWAVSGTVRSLVSDALFGGVGTVVSFVPVIVVLFFFLSLIEDSGYMARVAFVSDKLLRKIGLSGRSIVPMLIGFGCTVPGVMASRTLPSAQARRMTIMLTPFMSCSAKIAVYSFLINAFIPEHSGLVMVGLYVLGIFVGVLVALIRKWLNRDGENSPFVMELPVYRLPNPKNVGHLLWDKTKDFIQRAFSVIFLATLVIWALQSFDFRLNFVTDGSESILAHIAGLIAPIFSPMGLGDWRIVTSLISGLMAKESVVSTMEVLGATQAISALTVIPLLVFCLLYTPCVAAIAAIRRELGSRWAFYIVLFQCVIAWVCAMVAYLVAGMFI